MSRSPLEDARYSHSAAELAGLPDETGAEVAFAGRSNAGKSSALNALCNRKQLAFVSKTPGRTQQINFFALDLQQFLVDLPGYGFARVSGQLKKHWEALLGTYLLERQSLRGLVMIMDARHPLMPLDRQMLEWLRPTNRPVHVLLTKADKLSRHEGTQQLNQLRRELQGRFAHCTAQLFSSVTRQGLEEARSVVEHWLSEGVVPLDSGYSDSA